MDDIIAGGKVSQGVCGVQEFAYSMLGVVRCKTVAGSLEYAR